MPGIRKVAAEQKRGLLRAVAIVSCLAVAAGCGRQGGTGGQPRREPRNDGKIVIATTGSDTLVDLAQAWAEAYRKVAPNVTVEVSGGGSGVGIRDLIGGVAPIANISRDMEKSEIEQARQKTGKTPIAFTVAYDALAVYVNRRNPVDTLSMEELAGIYGEDGTINNWSQLGIDMKSIRAHDRIVRVSRQNSSGTYAYFREKVLHKKDFRMGSNDMSGSKDAVQLVGTTPGAIAYSGMGYITDSVKFLKVAARKGVPGYAPSLETIRAHKYPLARSLMMCTLGEPDTHIKAYIQWILSPAGQAIVEEAGYVPVSAGGAEHSK